MANPNPRTDIIAKAGEATRFKPGHAGMGPRKRPMSETSNDRLRAPLDNETRIKMRLPIGATQADAISWTLVEKAKRGDVLAARELRESVEGKSTARHEISSAEDRRWVVELEYAPLDTETAARVERYDQARKELSESPIDVPPEPTESE